MNNSIFKPPLSSPIQEQIVCSFHIFLRYFHSQILLILFLTCDDESSASLYTGAEPNLKGGVLGEVGKKVKLLSHV